jgi:hypothetical protein
MVLQCEEKLMSGCKNVTVPHVLIRELRMSSDSDQKTYSRTGDGHFKILLNLIKPFIRKLNGRIR